MRRRRPKFWPKIIWAQFPFFNFEKVCTASPSSLLLSLLSIYNFKIGKADGDCNSHFVERTIFGQGQECRAGHYPWVRPISWPWQRAEFILERRRDKMDNRLDEWMFKNHIISRGNNIRYCHKHSWFSAIVNNSSKLSKMRLTAWLLKVWMGRSDHILHDEAKNNENIKQLWLSLSFTIECMHFADVQNWKQSWCGDLDAGFNFSESLPPFFHLWFQLFMTNFMHQVAKKYLSFTHDQGFSWSILVILNIFLSLISWYNEWYTY